MNEGTIRQQRLLVMASIGLVVLSQALLILWPIVGAYANTLVFVILLTIGLRLQGLRAFASVAATVPAVTFIALVTPGEWMLRTTVVYAALLVLALVLKMLLPVNALLINKGAPKSPGMFLWTACISLSVGIAGAAAYTVSAPDGLFLPGILLLSIIMAISEEVFFRGLLQHQLTRLVRPAVAAGGTVLLGAGMALMSGNVAIIAFATAGHAAFSWLYFRYSSLPLVILANVASKLVFVAGLSLFLR